ncbi:MAG: bifunctional tetrahydrofolate synthase/dihydrofolate synthase [Thiolinea sp.]
MSGQRSLQDWLSWQESLHLSAIDLGLDRVGEVAKRLSLLQPGFPVITVAGTNGKGSTVALLSALLDEAGYKVGAYTSPHILKYNERIALNRVPVADEPICEAFAAIDEARGDISLTYFEFGTLAAMWVFMQAEVDVVVLEVGLGGRLDAANLWDADVAVITSIGVDHISWLGDDREVIGREKAGVARQGRPLICGDPKPPASIAAYAQEIGAELVQYGKEFNIQSQGDTFSISLEQVKFQQQWNKLPLPALLGEVQLQNAACALIALRQLADKFDINSASINRGLASVSLAGRLQKLQSSPDVFIDVAHNPHAAKQLALWLQKNPPKGATYVLFSILSDKDITGVLEALLGLVDEWHFFPLQDLRAMPVEDIQSTMDFHKVAVAVPHEGLKQAWNALKPRLKSEDRVVAFGSFLVVSSMLED